MSSQDVAKYLCEVGANQRKLQYCRQILASNTNFIPECVFNLKDPLNTNTQTKTQFIQNIRTLALGCNPQEQTLIFNYFQIDSKNYITFGEFTDLIVPQTDNAIKKIISMRRKEDFTLDYSLRYCLQKYFFQIIENQVKLQLSCKFTFPKGDDKRTKNKRLDESGLTDFMNAHGKYPDSKICQFIVRQMGLNKGDCKRHKLITEFINQFNEQYRRKEALPEVLSKNPVVIETTSQKENKNNVNAGISQSKKLDLKGSKAETNPLLNGNLFKNLATSSLMQVKASKVMPSPLESLGQVEKRISSLMSQVNLSRKNSSPIKQMYKKDSGKEQLMRNGGSDIIREDIQRQRSSRVQSQIENSFTSFKKTPQGAGKLTDRQNKNDEFQFDAVTEKNHTDRVMDSKSKINVNEEKKQNSHSQLIYKPVSRIEEKTPIQSKSAIKKFDYRVEEKKQKQERSYKERIEYLKNLVGDQQRSSKVQA